MNLTSSQRNVLWYGALVLSASLGTFSLLATAPLIFILALLILFLVVFFLNANKDVQFFKPKSIGLSVLIIFATIIIFLLLFNDYGGPGVF